MPYVRLPPSEHDARPLERGPVDLFIFSSNDDISSTDLSTGTSSSQPFSAHPCWSKCGQRDYLVDDRVIASPDEGKRMIDPTKPILLFLPSESATFLSSFREVMCSAHLVNDFNIVGIDPRAYGLCNHALVPAQEIFARGPSIVAADVLAALDTLGWSEIGRKTGFHLLTSATSCPIATLIAASQPDLVRGLIYVCPPSQVETPESICDYEDLAALVDDLGGELRQVQCSGVQKEAADAHCKQVIEMFLEGMQMRWLGNAAWPPGLRETICDSWLWRWLKCENGMEDVATLLSVIAYRQAIPDSVWSKVEASVLTIRGDLLQPYPESQESMYQSKLVSARKFESLVIQGAPMVVTITHPEHVAFAVSRFLHAIQGSSTSVELGTPAVTEEACRNDKAPSFAEPGPIDRRVYERLMTQSGFAHLIPLRFANGESRRGQAVSQGGVADVDDVSSCCSSGSGITDPTGSGDAACPSNTSEAGSFRSDLARWTPTAAGVEDLNDGVEIAQSWSCQAWAEEASSDLAADDQAFGDGSRDRTSFGAMVCANPIRYNLDLPLTTRARQGTIYFELVVDRDQSSSPPLLEDETGGSHQDVPNDVLESLADVL